jgi:hypothetical protein
MTSAPLDLVAVNVLGPVTVLLAEFDGPPVSPQPTPTIATATTDANIVNLLIAVFLLSGRGLVTH